MNTQEFLEKIGKRGSVPGLDNMFQMLRLLKHPESELPVIHITGTNGKGSTSNYLSYVLSEAGYKVGLFTSPSIETLLERIVINQINISQEDFDSYLLHVAQYVEDYHIPMTEFEVTVIMAILYFVAEKVDIAIFEVGMGGKLDATNVFPKKIANVITHIGYDHMSFLGNTLEEIASNKAGIIHAGEDTVLYPQSKEVEMTFQKRVKSQQGRLFLTDFSQIKNITLSEKKNTFSYKTHIDIQTQMTGKYQLYNATLALETIDLLRHKGYEISERAVLQGMAATFVPGRFQLLHSAPKVYVDGAHNPQGATALMENLRVLYPNQKFHFIMGTYKDKDFQKTLALTSPLALSYSTVNAAGERNFPSQDLAHIACQFCSHVKSYPCVSDALNELLSQLTEKDIVVIFGTLSIIGQALQYFKEV